MQSRWGFSKTKEPLKPQIVGRVEFEDYVREKVVITTRPGLQMPAFLLTPKGRQKRLPGIVCVPGHSRGKDDIVGIEEDGSQRSELGGYQKISPFRRSGRDTSL
ncbi:MAG: alpha/beta hydrolase family protein [Candidatus Latescibacteria bacterium]|nr:alpha/beta hydrolase family protein [Candidatus Latescibacterota bacterium]